MSWINTLKSFAVNYIIPWVLKLGGIALPLIISWFYKLRKFTVSFIIPWAVSQYRRMFPTKAERARRIMQKAEEDWQRVVDEEKQAIQRIEQRFEYAQELAHEDPDYITNATHLNDFLTFKGTELTKIIERDSDTRYYYYYKSERLQFIRPLADVSEKELRFYKLALKLCALGILSDEIPRVLLWAIVWNNGDTKYTSESAKGLNSSMCFTCCEGVYPAYIGTTNAAISRFMRQISNIKKLLGNDHEIVSIMETEMGVGQRWLIPADCQKSKLISMEKETETSVFLGNLSNGQSIYETSNQSLITIAPPGSGKTQCHVLPNIPSYGGSVIVLDVKGECYTETAESRAELGSVFRFGPTYNDSHSFNPLGHLDVDSDDFFDDCKALSALMIVPEGKDTTWELRARDLLSVFIAYTVIMHDAPTLEPVLDLASGVGLESTLETLADKEAEHAAIIPRSLRREAAGLLDTLKRSEKQFEGYIGSLKQHLSVWDTSAIERITEKSDWTPKIFRQEKATLYLCVAAEDIERFAPVMRVIIGQHVRELLKTAEDECWPPVLFMLDELPRLGQMAPIRTALETGRGKGIKLWMICQYQAQLMEAYGKDIAKGMMGSCSVELYMNPSAEDAEFISKRLGNQVDVQTAKDRPLATPQDLVGPRFGNSVVAFVKGTEPVLLEKQFFYEN